MLILRITLGEKSHFSVYQKCSVTQKYVRNAFSAWAPLQTPLWELMMLLRPLVLSRLGRDTLPLQTFGASIVTRSALATCAPPPMPGAPLWL